MSRLLVIAMLREKTLDLGTVMSDEDPYSVVEQEDRFVVVNGDGRKVMTCRDDGSAQHYASILTQAYKRGYRHGYQARTKESNEDPD